VKVFDLINTHKIKTQENQLIVNNKMMKYDASIPLDIQQLIEDRYINGDWSANKKADWNNYTEFEKELKNLYPKYVVRNNTDYNYNFGYEYVIYLTRYNTYIQNQGLALLVFGSVKCIGVSISKIIPYFCINYYSITKKGAIAFTSPNKEKQQQEAAIKLETLLKSRGYKQITLETSQLIVPHIETELNEKGEATVRDCIF